MRRPAATGARPAARVTAPAALAAPAPGAPAALARRAAPGLARGRLARIATAPARRAQRGLTLIEMLVVLVLVSLLGALLIQGTGYFLGRYAHVTRVHRDASLASLRQHWFVSTVQAMVASRVATRQFTGDTTTFEGTTLQPLAAESGLPVRVRWSISGDPGGDTVVYTEGGGEPWTVFTSGGGRLSFEYADAAGAWQSRWQAASDARERIPRTVRLVSTEGGTVWLARLALHPEPVPNYREEL